MFKKSFSLRIGHSMLLLSLLASLTFTPVALKAASLSLESVNEPNLFKDINLTTAGSDGSRGTAMGSNYFFSAWERLHGKELWKSDGTSDGTQLIKDINPGSDNSDPYQFYNLNGTLFFSAEEPSAGRELWKSNGTESGTGPGKRYQFQRRFIPRIHDQH